MSSRPIPRQSPLRLPVIAMTDLVALRAAVRQPCGACGGNLWFTPPLLTSGYISCLACSIETAMVLEVIPPPIDFSRMPPEKRGRPPKIAPRDSSSVLGLNGRWARDYDACVSCGRTDARHNARGNCERCKRRFYRAAEVAS